MSSEYFVTYVSIRTTWLLVKLKFPHNLSGYTLGYTYMSDSKKSHTQINTLTHNEAAWDHQALLQHDWSKPVSSELIEAAKKGQWDVHITR